MSEASGSAAKRRGTNSGARRVAAVQLGHMHRLDPGDSLGRGRDLVDRDALAEAAGLEAESRAQARLDGRQHDLGVGVGRNLHR